MRKYKQQRILCDLAIQSNKRNKGMGKITSSDLFKIAHKQRLICSLTGERLTRQNVSVDHILPSSKGGLNVPQNIRLTTRNINWCRGTMTDDELLALCQSVVNHMKM